jgi:hypothetical protein
MLRFSHEPAVPTKETGDVAARRTRRWDRQRHSRLLLIAALLAASLIREWEPCHSSNSVIIGGISNRVYLALALRRVRVPSQSRPPF